MVSQQVTHNDKSSTRSTDWARSGDDDSVRITAQVPLQVRRQILREFFEVELPRAQAIAASEANDFRVLRGNGQPHAAAELRAANATAVLQYIGATLKAFSGDNRDYRAGASS